MAWFDDKATGDEITSNEWDNHVVDQENRGYNDLRTVTSNTTANPQEVLLADSSGGNLTITLPSPESAAVVTIKKISGSGNTVTVATPGSETIDGSSSLSISAEDVARELISDGSNYFII